jgi:hypothetical protein
LRARFQDEGQLRQLGLVAPVRTQVVGRIPEVDAERRDAGDGRQREAVEQEAVTGGVGQHGRLVDDEGDRVPTALQLDDAQGEFGEIAPRGRGFVPVRLRAGDRHEGPVAHRELEVAADLLDMRLLDRDRGHRHQPVWPLGGGIDLVRRVPALSRGRLRGRQGQ